MIMELVGSWSLPLTIGKIVRGKLRLPTSNRSRLRHLKNGVPHGSVLVPLLFNICTSELPSNVFRKYAYADYLAIMHADADWQLVEGC